MGYRYFLPFKIKNAKIPTNKTVAAYGRVHLLFRNPLWLNRLSHRIVIKTEIIRAMA